MSVLRSPATPAHHGAGSHCPVTCSNAEPEDVEEVALEDFDAEFDADENEGQDDNDGADDEDKDPLDVFPSNVPGPSHHISLTPPPPMPAIPTNSLKLTPDTALDLTSQNWKDWSHTVLNILNLMGLQPHVVWDHSFSLPDNHLEPMAYDNYLQNDQAMMAFLDLHLSKAK
ncbi:hypothetical protein IW262DRAFT_1456837 [Armillaria fumosa]|nr:hypothetical protein IW262DRAFT_1456837 [Armillaria fumosa]